MPRKYYKANLEISNLCNLQCSFCPEVVRTKKLIDPDQFRHTIEQVKPFTKVVTLHLMGDPLVHPKLGELVEICAERAMQIYLVTNGLLLREKETQILLHPCFRQVSFSLHSFPDNFPNRDPGPYLERIFAFTERALQERPSLFINYRLWNLADPRGAEARNREVLARIEARFGVTVPPIDTEIQKNFKVQSRLFLHFDTEFTWPALGLPILHESGTCQGLSSHFGVLVDGTVVPCCLDKEGSIPLGNLHTTPLQSILESPRARKMLEGFRKGKLVEDLCKRCQYIERFA